MNRRDAALIAHLDAIEGRLTSYLLQIIEQLTRIREDVSGIKVDLATHRHEGGE
jgi:hypothetical protein